MKNAIVWVWIGQTPRVSEFSVCACRQVSQAMAYLILCFSWKRCNRYKVVIITLDNCDTSKITILLRNIRIEDKTQYHSPYIWECTVQSVDSPRRSIATGNEPVGRHTETRIHVSRTSGLWINMAQAMHPYVLIHFDTLTLCRYTLPGGRHHLRQKHWRCWPPNLLFIFKKNGKLADSWLPTCDPDLQLVTWDSAHKQCDDSYTWCRATTVIFVAWPRNHAEPRIVAFSRPCLRCHSKCDNECSSYIWNRSKPKKMPCSWRSNGSDLARCTFYKQCADWHAISLAQVATANLRS